MVHGILPGPTLMTEYADVTYTLIWAVLFANLALFVVGLAFTRASVYVTQIPNRVIAPIIVVLCVIGSFAINNSVFDVGLMLAFGIVGYVFDRLHIPTAPMVLGLILGPLLDGSLHQALLIGDGSYFIFIESPISAGLLAVAVLSIIQSSPAGRWLAKPFRALFKRRAGRIDDAAKAVRCVFNPGGLRRSVRASFTRDRARSPNCERGPSGPLFSF